MGLHLLAGAGAGAGAVERSLQSGSLYVLTPPLRARQDALGGPSGSEGDGESNMRGLRRLAVLYVRGRVQRHEIVGSTADRTRTVLHAFVSSYGGRDVERMGRRDIERWLATRSHLSAGTRRNEVVVVRGFVRWLVQERKIKTDPMVSIRSPKVPRGVPRSLSDDEVRRLWFALPDDRARAMVALMIGMGLRRGEVIVLQTGDWDRGADIMRVVGKGGHTRLLPVPKAVADILDRYLTGLRAGPLIRRQDGVTGISNSYIGALTRKWMEDAGIKAGPFDGKACHSLRHTLASRVADREPDLRVLQQILGHVSLTSTQVYLRHAEMSKLRAAMDGAA